MSEWLCGPSCRLGLQVTICGATATSRKEKGENSTRAATETRDTAVAVNGALDSFPKKELIWLTLKSTDPKMSIALLSPCPGHCSDRNVAESSKGL